MAENEQEKTQDEKSVSPIRTYQSDVQEMLKSGEGSLAKIAIAENNKRAGESFDFEKPEKTSQTGIIYAISIGLIVLGIGTLAFLYFFRNSPSETPEPLSDQTPQIIATDVEKILNIGSLEREAILSALAKEEKEEKVTLSSVLGIKITEGIGNTAKQITAENFLLKLQSHAPDELVRSLGDNFMFGLHSLNTNKPFLILKTNYYQNAFAGMIAWEKDLTDDLGPIFIEPEPLVFASTSEQVLNTKPAFEDIVVKNRDTRALRDRNGKIVFLYSFPDKNTIVLTTNADTLEKIATRLIASKMVQ